MGLTRRSQGYSLVELTIMIGLVSLAILGLVGVMMFVSNVQKSAQHSSAVLSARSEILAVLSDPVALEKTIQSAESTFDCIRLNLICPLVEQGTSLFNHNDQRIETVAAKGNQYNGFTYLGKPCAEFNPVVGDDDCVFQVRVFWSPVCSAPCVPTQIRWRVEFRRSPSPTGAHEEISNIARHSFEVLSNVQSTAVVVGIDSGLESVCAWLSDMRIKCWGRNDDGQLARGFLTPLPSGIPTADYALGSDGTPLEGVIQAVDANDTICALLNTGRMVCWGENFEGQLGRHSFGGVAAIADFVLNPLGTAPFENVHEAVSGENFVCLRTGADYYCWGSSNFREHPSPSTVPGAFSGNLTSLPSRIQAGATSSLPAGWTKFFSDGVNVKCVLAPGGELSCWGHEIEGALGNGPNLVGVAPGYGEFDANANHRIPSVGVTTRFANSPGVPGQNLTGVVDLSIGKYTLCALLASTEVVCWGRNEAGQAGQGASAPTPAFPGYVLSSTGVGRLSGVQEVSVGNRHACARVVSGDLYCWGRNSVGQLGDGTRNDSAIPRRVTGLPARATSVELGMNHSCALLETGKVYCWGANDNGEVGNGSLSTDVIVPSEVIGL